MLIDKKIFYKNLIRLALPIALQSLMLAAVAAGDALMLGKVAQDEMTAVSLATQIQFVQNMFLGAITAAGAILGAQYWGKGDRRTLEDIFNIMLRFCMAVSVLFFLACEWMPEQLMHIFAKDDSLIAIGSSYLRVAGWSYLLTGISQCYLTMMKVSEHVRPGALISSCAVLLNIGLNAVFIFGLFGAPRMQARGAALATTISRVAAVARDLICCMCNGIGSAAGIMVGNELGAGRLDRGKAYGIKLRNLSFAIGFLSAALVLAATPLMVKMVILTDQAREYLTGMMVIMSVYMIGRCVNTVTINGVLDGGGDTLFDMYSLIVCMWLIAIPLAMAGAFLLHWSPLVVYACTCLDEVGKIPWVMLRFGKYKWVQDLTR